MNIVKYEWNLGNETTSSSTAPITTYTPGVYDVSVTITLDNGATLTMSEDDFITVIETKENALSDKILRRRNTYDPRYESGSISYHYGVKEGVAIGWSRNTGDNLVRPESQAAVVHVIENGVDNLIVWDFFDDYPYCINPKNTPNGSIIHKDKDDHDISCSVTFGASFGEEKYYGIMHQESLFHIRNDLDTGSISNGISFRAALISDTGETLEERAVKVGNDVIFKEQSVMKSEDNKYMHIKLISDKSGFLCSGVDSSYKVIDSPRLDTDTVTPEEKLASVTVWLSAPDHSVDLVSGDSINTITNTYTETVDDLYSYGTTTSPTSITTDVTTGTIIIWSKDTDPITDYTMTEYGTKDGYTLYYFTGAIDPTIEIADDIDFFDFRIITYQLTTQEIYDYYTTPHLFIGG